MTFRLAGGLGERIIFRQLFQQGLTVFDTDEPDVDILHTNSHSAARSELYILFQTLGLPEAEFARWPW
jgi:chromosome partitioning protein